MAENIQTVSIAQETRTRFLRYALSVVTGRALPDVRDGLKPVQRRILYTMYYDANLTYERKAAKSAKIVGDVMGSYHPHGDSAIYDALVRLSQDWVMSVPLVYGEGNFGSVDGDPPAAYRYTEAKLTKAADALLRELDQKTVDTRDNYSGTKQEPIVLPAQFPNLLVNGTSGIAVGMATNIPPHNLGEVLRACILLIDNPDASVAQLLDKVKGPDFPLGGKIISDRATLRKIYEEGVGSIKVQGEWKEEKLERGRTQIVITSIPYGVNKSALEEAIGGIVVDKKVPHLLGISNESNDKDGMRITLELKTGADSNLVMAYIYKHTELQKTISYNMTALVPSADGHTLVPRDRLSLKDILRHFLDFRLVTVRRRYEFNLHALKKRIHILEGFSIIFNALDKAIKIIQNSAGKADAAEKLMNEFPLDQEQTKEILESQLYKIAQMEVEKIKDELKNKQKEAEKIEAILKSEKKLWNVIRHELEKLADSDLVVRRKTRMASDEDVLEFDEEAYIVRENTNVVLTRDGWIKRVGRLQSVESTRVRENDAIISIVPGSTLDTVIFFANDGIAYTMRIHEIPASSGYGEPITKFFKIADQVKILTAITCDTRFTPQDTTNNKEEPLGPFLLIATSAGNVLRLPIAAYRTESTKAGRKFVKLDEGDTVAYVALIHDEDGVMMASQNGYVIHFPLDQVNLITGVGKGVIGMKLDDNDKCIGAALVTEGRVYEANKLIVETESGKYQEYTPKGTKRQNRAGKGDKPGARTKFTQVMAPPIQLVNWDELDVKKAAKSANNGTLFD